MKFPWNKKNSKDKSEKINDRKSNKELDRDEVTQISKVGLSKKNVIKNEQKFRFDNALYSVDTLPDAAKQTLSILTKSDKLIKLYKEKLDILSFTRKSLNESLKRSLKSIEDSNTMLK